MVTMSAVDPTLLILVNIYADMYQDRQDTKVYNNGVMQVSVFVSVNYNGEASKDEIIEYVQDNVDIYSLNYGENVQWAKSTTDNGFHHDIDHAANENESVPPKMISDIRALLYFTVPGGTAEGEHRWIAKLNGKQTSTNTPLTVTVEKFTVNQDDFEIVQRDDGLTHVRLYVLKYKDDVFPSTQKLLNCINYRGFKFPATGGNAWISMAVHSCGTIGVFLEYRVTKNIQIAIPKRIYSQDEVVIQNYPDNPCHYGIILRGSTDTIEATADLDPTVVDNAWNEGVVMIQVSHNVQIQCYISGHGWLSPQVGFNDYLFQDTFGGRMEIKIDWNGNGYFGRWKVYEAKVVYP
uniref:Uncharacterized protein n=1 Tax=Amphimedon queenslandica TaxID=400682 RepID=A0A1X7SVH6_AMPQE